jgi:hypothetical protein
LLAAGDESGAVHFIDIVSANVAAGDDGPAQVFISYTREEAPLCAALAVLLEARGYAVWYDREIAGGQRFPQVIDTRIDAAEAVIALFSEAVVGADDIAQGYDSDWVVYEAGRAHKQGKLIPVCVLPLPADNIPAPYPAVLHIIKHGDDDELLRALREKGVAPA